MGKKKIKEQIYIPLIEDDFYNVLDALRRAFSRGKVCKEFLKDSRIEVERYKFSGEKAKKPNVRYKCAHCEKLFSSQYIQKDHREPVIPVQIPAKHMNIGIICRRLFVKKESLQILCKPCHKLKSDKENILRREWRKKDKHIVYMTTNLINGKMYIGVHRCVNMDDGYLGSGKALESAIKKYGKENFVREVLYVYDNADEAYKKEEELVSTDVVESDQFYNLTTGGRKGVPSEEARIRMSENMKGKYLGSKNPMYGKNHTEETRLKIGNREYKRGTDHVCSRRVQCIETGEIFSSITDARIGKKINICRAIATGGSAGGYHWKYLDEEPATLKPIKYSKRKVMCNETGEIFDSLRSAAISKGAKPEMGGKIGECCRGKRNFALNHTWSFVDHLE